MALKTDNNNGDNGNDIWQHETPSALEEIYVFRSVVVATITPLSTFCPTNAPFTANVETTFALWSLDTDNSTGLLSHAHRKEIGDIHVCTGPTTNPKVLNFYAQGHLNGVPFSTVRGEAILTSSNFPNTGATVRANHFDLVLPAPYIGGTISTNTMRNATPGYLTSSIASARLWK
jgi:hypothetical protein